VFIDEHQRAHPGHDDPASVCVQVNTIYGTARVARTNIVNGNVTCSGDGLSVKSEAVSVPVNLKVTPVEVRP
jgi:hypothetical protein